MNNDISLLFPNGIDIDNFSFNSSKFLKDLCLDSLFHYKRNHYMNGYYNFTDKIFRYFTNNKDVIEYRLEIMDDFMSHKEILEAFNEILDNIETIQSILGERSNSNIDLIDEMNSIAIIESYIEIVERFHSTFCQCKAYSKGLTALFNYIEDIFNSEEFVNLKKNVPEMAENITGIKSVTIGVNLYGDLTPIEAGLVSINREKYHSGDIIDRLLRLKTAKDEFTCLAPLTKTPSEFNNNEITAFNSSISTALKKVLSKNIKTWSPVIRHFVYENTQFIVNLYDEILFYFVEMALIDELNQNGINTCRPTIIDDEDIYKITNAYYPLFVNTNAQYKTPNDIIFDKEGGFYVLTGPNRGGKSVYLKTIGICQLLFQLGMYVPADSANMYCVDNIFTHLAEKSAEMNASRFEAECIQLREIFDGVTNKSMVLLDEMFSSTNSCEAEYLAKDILTALCYKGAKGVLVTHIHSLCSLTDEINLSDNCKTKLDNLSIAIDANQSHNFKVVRKRSDGKSYAREIAEKYQITLEKLMKVTLDS